MIEEDRNFKVLCRFRPCVEQPSCILPYHDGKTVIISKRDSTDQDRRERISPHAFQIQPTDSLHVRFDGIIQQDDSQSQIFSAWIENAISDLLAGRSLSLIVFGTSGSGKSFTMRGGEGKRRGLVLRSAEMLLSLTKKKENTYDVKVSVIAVCGERIFDLITNTQDRSEVTIKKITDLHAILHQALKHRKQIGKELKEKLHFIVTMRVYKQNSLISQGDFVELAASEYAKGDKSISSAFNSLANILKKTTGNWYDNALTSYLRNTLDVYNPFNPSQAIIICCIYPVQELLKDTITLLNFTSKMREIAESKSPDEEKKPLINRLKAKIEEIPDPAKTSQDFKNSKQFENNSLKGQIERIRESWANKTDRYSLSPERKERSTSESIRQLEQAYNELKSERERLELDRERRIYREQSLKDQIEKMENLLYEEKESHLLQIKLLQNAMAREGKNYNEPMATKRGENDEVLMKNEEIKRLKAQNEENLSAVGQYKEQLAAKNSMIYHLQQINNDLRAKVEEYKSKFDLSEERIRLYKQKQEEMRNTMIIIRNNMEKSKLSLEEKDRQLEQLKFAMDSPERLTRRDRLENADQFISPDFCRQLAKAEEIHEKTVSSLTDDMEKYKATIKDLNDKLASLQSENQKLSSKSSKIDKIEEELQNLQIQYSSLEKEFSSREETYIEQIFKLEEQLKSNNSDARVSDSEFEQPPPNQNLHTSMTQLSTLSIQDALFTCKNLISLLETLMNPNQSIKKVKELQNRLEIAKKEIMKDLENPSSDEAFDVQNIRKELDKAKLENAILKQGKNSETEKSEVRNTTINNILELAKDLEKKLKEELEFRNNILEAPKSTNKLDLSNIETISDITHDYCKIELKNMHSTVEELKGEIGELMKRLENCLKENRSKEEHIQNLLISSSVLDSEIQNAISIICDYENIVNDLKKFTKHGSSTNNEKVFQEKTRVEIENEELKERVKNLKQKLYEERSKSDREVFKFKQESDLCTEKNENTSAKLEILQVKYTKLKLDNDCLKINNNELMAEIEKLKKPNKEVDGRLKKMQIHIDHLKDLLKPNEILVEDIF
ncbi:unnamed protein product [Blepharisma stoltei]|uniref:Kinesin motor domain-containing protein n=1 Tax=Blepharisma stoltei TaxID=1481888 RepID=A0AAU9JIY7_9CILI|nr:unnamed protein product [Blepharisma stoltei]